MAQKRYKVTLIFNRRTAKYTVAQLTGERVRIEIGRGTVIRAGDVLSENEANQLGNVAIITVKPSPVKP
jgi:urease accessory protein UreE